MNNPNESSITSQVIVPVLAAVTAALITWIGKTIYEKWKDKSNAKVKTLLVTREKENREAQEMLELLPLLTRLMDLIETSYERQQERTKARIQGCSEPPDAYPDAADAFSCKLNQCIALFVTETHAEVKREMVALQQAAPKQQYDHMRNLMLSLPNAINQNQTKISPEEIIERYRLKTS